MQRVGALFATPAQSRVSDGRCRRDFRAPGRSRVLPFPAQPPPPRALRRVATEPR